MIRDFSQTILGDFQKEQERFLQEKKAKQTGKIMFTCSKSFYCNPVPKTVFLVLLGAAVPPWVGFNEEETVQQQILSLSAVRIIGKIFVVK